MYGNEKNRPIGIHKGQGQNRERTCYVEYLVECDYEQDCGRNVQYIRYHVAIGICATTTVGTPSGEYRTVWCQTVSVGTGL